MKKEQKNSERLFVWLSKTKQDKYILYLIYPRDLRVDSASTTESTIKMKILEGIP